MALELLSTSNVEELDLSWCKVPRHAWTKFFKNLGQLKSLSLAGNSIIELSNNHTIKYIADFIANGYKL